MDLIQLVVVLVVVGLILWLIQNYLPIAQPIKNVIVVLVVLIFILWLLGSIGLIGNVPVIRRRIQ